MERYHIRYFREIRISQELPETGFALSKEDVDFGVQIMQENWWGLLTCCKIQRVPVSAYKYLCASVRGLMFVCIVDEEIH